MNRLKKIKAFTLVELMVVVAIFSVISAMAFNGMISLSKGIKRPKDISISRKEMGIFVDTLYKFINNSFSVYFVDLTSALTPPEFDYLTPLSPYTNADSRLDILYLVKDTNDTTARIVYNSTDHTFEYYRTGSTTTPQIMLTDVYRPDASWDNSGNLVAGVEPIFKFPHISSLYDSVNYNAPRPKTVIVQFRRVVATGGSEYIKPISVPLTLMIEVNVSTFETV